MGITAGLDAQRKLVGTARGGDRPDHPASSRGRRSRPPLMAQRESCPRRQLRAPLQDSSQKQPDVTVLLRVKGSAAPSATAAVSHAAKFCSFPRSGVALGDRPRQGSFRRRSSSMRSLTTQLGASSSDRLLAPASADRWLPRSAPLEFVVVQSPAVIAARMSRSTKNLPHCDELLFQNPTRVKLAYKSHIKDRR